MGKQMIYIIGFYFIFTFVFSLIKRNNPYTSFVKGIKEGIQITINMFSILLVFSFCIKCIENCGIINYLTIKLYNSQLKKSIIRTEFYSIF